MHRYEFLFNEQNLIRPYDIDHWPTLTLSKGATSNFNFSESPSVKYRFCEKYMIVEDILLQRKNFNAICGLLSKSQQYMYDFKVIFATENLRPF